MINFEKIQNLEEIRMGKNFLKLFVVGSMSLTVFSLKSQDARSIMRMRNLISRISNSRMAASIFRRTPTSNLNTNLVSQRGSSLNRNENISSTLVQNAQESLTEVIRGEKFNPTIGKIKLKTKVRVLNIRGASPSDLRERSLGMNINSQRQEEQVVRPRAGANHLSPEEVTRIIRENSRGNILEMETSSITWNDTRLNREVRMNVLNNENDKDKVVYIPSLIKINLFKEKLNYTLAKERTFKER